MMIKKISYSNVFGDPLFWSLIFLSLGLRSFFYYYQIDPWMYPDSYQYERLAQLIYKKLSFGPRIWLVPGYPVFLAITKWISADGSRWVAVTVQHLAGVVSVALLYDIGRRFFSKLSFGRIYAFIAALLYLNPRFLLYDHTVLTDSLFTFLVLLQGYGVIRYFEARRYPWLFLTAVCFGLSILTKPIDQLAWTVVLITLLLFRLNWRRFGREVLILMLPIIVIVSVWVLRNYQQHNYFGLSAYGGYQRLIRTLGYLDQTEVKKTKAHDGVLGKFSAKPKKGDRERLQELTGGGAQYQQALQLWMKRAILINWKKRKGVRSSTVYATFLDFYRAGFPELEVVGTMGGISAQIMAAPGSYRRHLQDALWVHLPDMMLLGRRRNVPNINAGWVTKQLKKQQQADAVGARVFQFYLKGARNQARFIFIILTPMAIAGLLWAWFRQLNSAFTCYAVLRIGYFVTIVTIFGNGLERYRLPIDHLLMLGVAACLAAFVELITVISRFVRPIHRDA